MFQSRSANASCCPRCAAPPTIRSSLPTVSVATSRLKASPDAGRCILRKCCSWQSAVSRQQLALGNQQSAKALRIPFRERKSQQGWFFLDKRSFCGDNHSLFWFALRTRARHFARVGSTGPERKKHALEENGDANPETQLLCSDSYCDLGQSVICFRRPGTLSSRLPAYKSLLRLPIAAKTISPAGRRSFRLYSESSSGFS